MTAWRMSRPTTRNDSSNGQYVRRLPADVANAMRGAVLALEFPATSTAGARAITARAGRHFIRFSLGASDEATVRARWRHAESVVDKLIAATRSGPVALTHREAVALSGEVYRKFLDEHSEEPATRQTWAAVKAFNRAIREGRRLAIIPPLGISPEALQANTLAASALAGAHANLSASVNALGRDGYEPAEDALETRFGALADYVLALHGLVVDGASRRRLLVQIEASTTDAAKDLKRYADGDYRPSGTGERFPAFAPRPASPKARHAAQPASPPQAAASISGPTWDALLAAWSKRHELADRQAATRKQVASLIHRFAASVRKRPDAVTRQDIEGWIASRRESGVSLSTIRTQDAAYLRRLYRVAFLDALLPEGHPDPTARLEVPRSSGTSKAAARSRRRGYSDAEARLILAAAGRQTDPLLRYVPLILAYSGARASEVVCLRACDVKTIDGYSCFSVTPEAGRHVKTAHSIRDVPLHKAVIDAGFLEFVAEKAADERLFFSEGRTRRGIGVLKPGKKANTKLRRWVRSVPGLVAGSAVGLDPNHAWRHRIKTLSRDAGIDSAILDAICGHAPASVGAGYGEVSMRAKAAAIAKLPAP